jgi:AhpD family alkylhydroperoxidase
MKPRLNPYETAPDAVQAVAALEGYVRDSGIEPALIHLVKIRASQINGCACCIHMHTREARGRGESEERLYLLDAWRESPLYTERERAALAWTEAVTLVSKTPCAGRGLRGGKAVLLRGGDRQADGRRGDDQRLEPDRDQLPDRPSGQRRACRLTRLSKLWPVHPRLLLAIS